MPNPFKTQLASEIRDGRLERDGYGYFNTLIYADGGRDKGGIVYQTVDGGVHIMGSWLDEALPKLDGAELLETLVDELARRFGGCRPLLAMERSRRPDGEQWAVLVTRGHLETHEMYEAK
jgi:hypothetical protein